MARRQDGVVLIVVLWVVSLLTVLLIGFAGVARVEREASVDLVQRVSGRASAEAVLAYLGAVKGLGADVWDPILGQVLVMPLSPPVRFRVVPEDAFLSLNGASKEMLQQLFRQLAPEVHDPEWLAETVVARRVGNIEAGTDPDPWRSVNELLLLDSVRPDAIQPVLGLLTVDSEHDGVNERYAAPALIRALYPDRAESILAARLSGESAAVGAGGGGAQSRPLLRAGLARFRVQVEVGGSGKTRHLEATATFDNAAGYQVVRWNEYNVAFTFDE